MGKAQLKVKETRSTCRSKGPDRGGGGGNARRLTKHDTLGFGLKALSLGGGGGVNGVEVKVREFRG